MSDGETVTIRPGVKLDSNQNPVATTGATFEIPGCVVEPLGSDESTDFGRNGTATRLKIYAPNPVNRVITATDIAVVRGLDWQIEGDADLWIDDDADLSGPVFTIYRGKG